jgi:hypothetical protein
VQDDVQKLGNSIKLGTGFENEAQIFKGTKTIQAQGCGQIRPFTILENSKFTLKWKQ